jgi:hypothetical protein
MTHTAACLESESSVYPLGGRNRSDVVMEQLICTREAEDARSNIDDKEHQGGAFGQRWNGFQLLTSQSSVHENPLFLTNHLFGKKKKIAKFP